MAHYVRLSVDFFDHPKIAPLPESVQNAFIRLLAHCGKYETDGIVQRSSFRSANVTTAKVKRLIAAGLVYERDTHVEVHDYLDWQASHMELERGREKARERQQRFRERHAEGPKTNGHVTPLRDAVAHAHVTPLREAADAPF